MAIMTDQQRFDAWAEYMRDEALGSCAITKTQLRAALDAADQWVSDNAASFNSALPAQARNNLTSAQKAMLLMHVVRKRFLSGT